MKVLRKAVLFGCAAAMMLGLSACGETVSIELSGLQHELVVGESVEIVAVTEGRTGELIWGAEPDGIVTVEPAQESATVIAVAAGETVVYAEFTQNGKTYRQEYALTVTPAPEPLLTVGLPTGKLVLRRNESARVRAYAEGTLSGEAVWESSDVSIGTVEYQGMIAVVTAVSRGECTITVTYGGEQCSFTLIVGI